MASASNNVLDLLQCPECGAACDRTAQMCWLCHATHNPFREQPELVATLVRAAPPAQWRRVLDGVFAVAFIATVIVIVLLAIGVGHDEPAALIPFLIFAGPPLLAVAVRESRLRASGTPPTWGQRLVTLLISAVVTVGIAALLMVAAIIGLILYCFSMLAGEIH